MLGQHVNRRRKDLSPLLVLGVSLALIAPAIGGRAAVADAQDVERTVVRVPITGTIELGLAPFVARALKEAAESGASAVVLDLDTPGRPRGTPPGRSSMRSGIRTFRYMRT